MTTSIADRRNAVLEWSAFAMSREVIDPVYRFFTEGRDLGPDYSSCGDLAHCVLFRAGCREPWINRVEAPGGYRPRKNVNLLCPEPVGKNPFARRALPYSYQPGDILLLCPPDDLSKWHVCVFEKQVGTQVHTFDLGQDPMSREAWAANTHWTCSERKVRNSRTMNAQYSISLDDVPWTAEIDLLSGERMDAIDKGR